MKRKLLWLSLHLLWTGGLCLFFGYAFYERYWHWRDCIAEALSSCVTPDGGNLTEGGAMWSVPAAFFGLLVLRVLYCMAATIRCAPKAQEEQQ